MNINIVLSVANEIAKFGLISIISNGILGSNVVAVDNDNILDKIMSNFYDIAIIEFECTEKTNPQILEALLTLKNRTKIYCYAPNILDEQTEKHLKSHNIEVLLHDSSSASIVGKLKFNIKYCRKRNFFVSRKNNKLKSLDSLLSQREYEIGTLLIQGYSVKNIAFKKNIATSTVSNYKRRIFEKTNVKNIIEMSKLFS